MSDRSRAHTDIVGSATTRTLLAVRAPLHASLSPDGRTLALTTVHVPVGQEHEVVELTLVDVASGRESAVPGARPGDRYAEWDPAGDRLAVLADDPSGETVVAIVDVADGRRAALASTARATGPAAWSPDGTRIAVPRRRGDTIDRTRPFRWTRPFLAADGVGPLEDPPQLSLVDPVADRSSWLTDDQWRWSAPQWDPTGERIAAVAGHDPTDRVGGQVLRLLDTDGVIDDRVSLGGRSVVARWLADSSLAVLLAEPHGRPGGSAAELHLVRDGTSRLLPVPDVMGDVFGDCAAELADVYDNLLLPAGRSLAVRTGSRGRLGVCVVDIDTLDVRVVLDGPRCCTPVARQGDLLVFTRQAPDTYVELATVDLPSADTTDVARTRRPAERPLVTFAADDVRAPVRVERFAAASTGGWQIDGWFLSSAGSDRPLPTVVVVHGGPHFTYGEAFSLDAQALCAAGFGVLYANPRGSLGYGDDFAHAIHGDWADGPSADVLAVVDEAVARGWADPELLGVTGNSYGGYLAAWLASTTDRFSAAVIENPVTDLIGMYGTSDIGRRFFPAQLGGPPHAAVDTYTGQSPLLSAHRCRTPCLFVVGELDRRCPSGQAWAMHRVLCEIGTPSEVLVLPGSAHEGTTYGPPAVRIAHDDALVDWMRAWLTGG